LQSHKARGIIRRPRLKAGDYRIFGLGLIEYSMLMAIDTFTDGVLKVSASSRKAKQRSQVVPFGDPGT
jgi:hypothetical protein